MRAWILASVPFIAAACGGSFTDSMSNGDPSGRDGGDTGGASAGGAPGNGGRRSTGGARSGGSAGIFGAGASVGDGGHFAGVGGLTVATGGAAAGGFVATGGFVPIGGVAGGFVADSGIIGVGGSDGGAGGSGGASFEGGVIGTGGSAADASMGGSVSADGSAGDAGAVGSGGVGGSGGAGTGGIDCSNVGCAAPPLCSFGCGDPCGCCPCSGGQHQDVGGRDYICVGGCYAPSVDGGAPTCLHNGYVYQQGAIYAAGDGCNTCACNLGVVTCTERVCPCDPAVESHQREYVGTPVECASIRYVCQPNTTTFQNACGCGCEQNPSCPDWFDCMPESGCDVDKLKALCPYSGFAF